MNEKQQILLMAKNLSDMIRAQDCEAEERARLIEIVLKRLPRVVLVDDDSLEKGAIIKGILDMFLASQLSKMTDEELMSKRAAFIFYPGDIAEIREGWYDGKCIVRDSWIMVFQSLLDLVVLSEVGLTERQKEAVEALAKAFRKKGD